jgi:hypothetical protein
MCVDKKGGKFMLHSENVAFAAMPIALNRGKL